MYFQISEVTTNPLIPFGVAFCIAFFCSMAGVSGGFLLLPFQVSILRYITPGVSSTNLLYNIIGTPAAVIRYIREKRLFWPLLLVLVSGLIPGILVGIFIHLKFMTDVRIFKIFVGTLLLLLGLNMLRNMVRAIKNNEHKEKLSGQTFEISNMQLSLQKITCEFNGKCLSFSTPQLFLLSFIVGIASGIYGIGGSGILAPLLVSIYRLPVYLTAGATLMANFVSSIIGVVAYECFASVKGVEDVGPDWALGTIMGAGGFLGMYMGARCQRFVPAIYIKFILMATCLYVGIRYLVISFL